MKFIKPRFLWLVLLYCCCQQDQIHGNTNIPTSQPTQEPSTQPTRQPSIQPSSHPTRPSGQPSCKPTLPSSQPSGIPTSSPTKSGWYPGVFNYAVVTQSIIGISTVSPVLFIAFTSAVTLALPSSSSFNIMKATSNSSNSMSSVVVVYSVACPISSRALITLLQSTSTAVIMNNEVHKTIPFASVSLPSSIILLATPSNPPTNSPLNSDSLSINSNSKIRDLIIGLVVGLGLPCILVLICFIR